jgi:hypothetical protein
MHLYGFELKPFHVSLTTYIIVSHAYFKSMKTMLINCTYREPNGAYKNNKAEARYTQTR